MHIYYATRGLRGRPYHSDMIRGYPHKICLCELSPKDVGQSQIEQLHKIDECVVGFHILEKDALYLS